RRDVRRTRAADPGGVAKRHGPGGRRAPRPQPRTGVPAAGRRSLQDRGPGGAARPGPSGVRMSEPGPAVRDERDLPPGLLLPLSTIGSFPKSERLKRARADFSRGTLDAAALQGIEQEETVACIRMQENLGLDLLVDGEMYRGDMTT